jgi:hypothetical protein
VRERVWCKAEQRFAASSLVGASAMEAEID